MKSNSHHLIKSPNVMEVGETVNKMEDSQVRNGLDANSSLSNSVSKKKAVVKRKKGRTPS